MKRVGVLGGGQLGRMLALKGAELGYEVHVLSEHADDPAAQVTRFWHQGLAGESAASIQNLTEFFKKVDVVTFESEFTASAAIHAASAASHTPARPTNELMSQLRDRLSQKKLLVTNKVKAAETFSPKTSDELREFLKDQNHGVVAKKRLFGYDGYGTFVLQNEKDPEKFLTEHETNLAQFIFEPLVNFKRELAISLARDLAGHVVFLPLVEWRARDKKCHWVKGPVKHKGIVALKRTLKNFVNKIDYCGLITFELFDLGKELLVNEIAPRVHNSAHYSLNGLDRDQFQLHLLAITTSELKADPKPLMGGFAMVNLTGTSNSAPVLPAACAAYMHWYSKKQNRPGRKMGHLNTIAKTADEALKLCLREEKRFQL